ncbi:MAG: hypothetical protein ACXITV_00020 [Luteibaculaceae bacterium]
MFRKSLFKTVYLIFLFLLLIFGGCAIKKYPAQYSIISSSNTGKPVLSNYDTPLLYQKKVKKDFVLVIDRPGRSYNVDFTRFKKINKKVTLNDTICFGNIAYFNQGCFILKEMKIDNKNKDSIFVYDAFKYNPNLEATKYNKLGRLHDGLATIRQISITQRGFVQRLEISIPLYHVIYNWDL